MSWRVLIRRVECNKVVQDSQAGPVTPQWSRHPHFSFSTNERNIDIFRRKKSVYIFVKTAAVLTFERFSIDYQRQQPPMRFVCYSIKYVIVFSRTNIITVTKINMTAILIFILECSICQIAIASFIGPTIVLLPGSYKYRSDINWVSEWKGNSCTCWSNPIPLAKVNCNLN